MRWGVRRRFHAGRGLNSFSGFVVALIAPLRDRLSLASARDLSNPALYGRTRAFRRGHYGILPWRLPFFKKFWRRSRQTDRASTRSHTQQKLCAPRRFLCVFATVCVISRATLWAHRLRSTGVIHSGATTAASDVVAVSSPKIGACAY